MLGITAILAWVIKAIYHIVKVVLYIVAYLLLYFGLWIPAIYMLICGILMLTGGLDLAVLNSNTILFYIGLAITLTGSLIISIRNLIVKPIKQIAESNKAKRELQAKKDASTANIELKYPSINGKILKSILENMKAVCHIKVTHIMTQTLVEKALFHQKFIGQRTTLLF